MSVFHHRAQLISRTDAGATYRYFPDTVFDATCEGVFRVHIPTWTVEMVRAAEAEARVGVTTDRQCVPRLVGKLREYVQACAAFPEQIAWIA